MIRAVGRDRVYPPFTPGDNRQTRGRCSIVAHRRMPNRPYVHCGVAVRPAFVSRESAGSPSRRRRRRRAGKRFNFFVDDRACAGGRAWVVAADRGTVIYVAATRAIGR